MKILRWWRKMRRQLSPYQPAVEVELSASALRHNLRTYQKAYAPVAIAPVLKSNAYGHGLLPIAQILDQENLPFFVVDSWPEAHTLRAAGIHTPILIIGYVAAENIKNSKLAEIAFTITSLEQLVALAPLVKSPAKIHLKIDTGMHRQGLPPSEIDTALDLLRAHPKLRLEGVCSHLADADNEAETLTRKQLKTWQLVLTQIKKVFPALKYAHLSNTAGAHLAEAAGTNLIRLGLGLYGFNSSPLSPLSLKPVLSLTTIVSSVREIPAGEKVGYNGTYETAQTTRLATVPVGYYEGVDRRLSNLGVMKIGEKFCPIAGRVSMNITSLDVSGLPTVELGTRVIVLSREANDPNSVEQIAKIIKTIPWEILVHIPAHLRRRVLP